jgi:hypothetical protein
MVPQSGLGINPAPAAAGSRRFSAADHEVGAPRGPGKDGPRNSRDHSTVMLAARITLA